jgi:hypothetical protein
MQSGSLATPYQVVGSPGGLQVSVSWRLITYTAVAFPGGASCSTTGLACVVLGLSPGISYVFNVTATNAAGQQTTSAFSNAVIPVSTFCSINLTHAELIVSFSSWPLPIIVSYKLYGGVTKRRYVLMPYVHIV